MDINSVTIAGRLAENCKTKINQQNIFVTSFSITSKRMKEKSGFVLEDCFDVILLGNQAEKLSKYLVKGKQVIIQGCIRQNSSNDELQTGQSKFYIKADFIQLVGGVRAEG